MLPDWRDPRAYSFTAGLSNNLWAWQFLRRNPEYRADWQETVEALTELIAIHGEESVRETLCAGGTLDPSDPSFMIYAPEVAEKTVKRWGTLGYFNPDQERPSELWLAGGAKVLGHTSPAVFNNKGETESPVLHLTLEPYEAVVQFDVRYPLEQQLRTAGRSLRFSRDIYFAAHADSRPFRPRRPDASWTLYLRVLDARTVGAQYDEIARVLFPHLGKDADPIKKVDDTLRKARQMIQPSHYLKIL